MFFDLAGQRAANGAEIRAALQSVSPISTVVDGWCRLINFKYSNEVLSPAGSLKWVGQRFNLGSDIDSVRFPPFPALYIAEDFETAFREYHGFPKDSEANGLRPEELSLEDRGNWVALRLCGRIDNLFDLTKEANLRAVCRVFAKFNLSDRVKELASKARQPKTILIKRPAQLLAGVMADHWREWPVHFDVPSNSQVFAQLVIDAGFEGILYRSAKAARRCIAVFTRQLANSESRIAVHADCPAGAQFAEISASNCNEV